MSNNILIIDDDVELPAGVDYIKSDLRHFENCLDVTRDIDIVFSLVGKCFL